MPYLNEHMLLQWTAGYQESASAAPFEIAVGGMRFTGAGIDPQDTDARMNQLAAVLKTFWADSAMFIPSNCYLRTVKWNRIGTNGKYVSQGDTRVTDFAPIAGGRTAAYPTQIALVASWTTAVTRGRAHGGRTYWPTAISVFPTTSKVAAQDAQTFANSNLKLVKALNAVFPVNSDTGLQAVVMSKEGAGATQPITGVRVGTRLDVQRRRANSMTDVYQVGVATT